MVVCTVRSVSHDWCSLYIELLIDACSAVFEYEMANYYV